MTCTLTRFIYIFFFPWIDSCCLQVDVQWQRYDSGVEEHIKDRAYERSALPLNIEWDWRLCQLSAGKAQADQRLPSTANAAAVGRITHTIVSFKGSLYPPVIAYTQNERKLCHLGKLGLYAKTQHPAELRQCHMEQSY